MKPKSRILQVLICGLDMAEERISEVEPVSVEFPKAKEQRKQK